MRELIAVEIKEIVGGNCDCWCKGPLLWQPTPVGGVTTPNDCKTLCSNRHFGGGGQYRCGSQGDFINIG